MSSCASTSRCCGSGFVRERLQGDGGLETAVTYVLAIPFVVLAIVVGLWVFGLVLGEIQLATALRAYEAGAVVDASMSAIHDIRITPIATVTTPAGLQLEVIRATGTLNFGLPWTIAQTSLATMGLPSQGGKP